MRKRIFVAALPGLAGILLAAVDLRADLALAEANGKSSEAIILQRQAKLRDIEIKSPVDGVVVKREVKLGQTAAQDLSEIDIYANIDEADVSRLAAQRVQNVVTPSPSAPGRSVCATRSAHPRDVLRQFLIEVATLSAISGALGVGLGAGAALSRGAGLRLTLARVRERHSHGREILLRGPSGATRGEARSVEALRRQ